VGVVDRGERRDDVPGLPEMLGVVVVRDGHLHEAVREPAVVGLLRGGYLDLVEGPAGDVQVPVDALVGDDVLLLHGRRIPLSRYKVPRGAPFISSSMGHPSALDSPYRVSPDARQMCRRLLSSAR